MVEQRVLNDVIERIVEVTEPEKIILFGSAARGGMGQTAILTCSSSRMEGTPSIS